MKFKDLYSKYKLENRNKYVSIEFMENEVEDAFLDRLASLLANGCDIICFDGKILSDKNFVELAKKVRLLTAQFGAIFLIKNRADVAFIVEADGICLDEQGLEVKDCRQILGENSLIGFESFDCKDVEDVDFFVTTNENFPCVVGRVFNINKC